jgi:hypothetical protein
VELAREASRSALNQGQNRWGHSLERLFFQL